MGHWVTRNIGYYLIFQLHPTFQVNPNIGYTLNTQYTWKYPMVNMVTRNAPFEYLITSARPKLARYPTLFSIPDQNPAHNWQSWKFAACICLPPHIFFILCHLFIIISNSIFLSVLPPRHTSRWWLVSSQWAEDGDSDLKKCFWEIWCWQVWHRINTDTQIHFVYWVV